MGWISWLCPGVNIKRWLLLAAFGMLLCAMGLAMFFNFQIMGRMEELIFQFTYYITGHYSNAVIMAGGRGTRISSIAKDIPTKTIEVLIIL